MNISLPSALKRFVDDQVKAGRYADASEVVCQSVRLMEARSQAPLPIGSHGSDIEALAMIVMMEAARSAQEDLKNIMESLKAINAAKQALRELLLTVKRDVAANSCFGKDERQLDFSHGMSSEKAYHHARVPCLDPDCPGGVSFQQADLYPRKISSVGDLCMVAEMIKSRLDSLCESGELESLRMQMAMDRRSKVIQTMSNILTKIDQTADRIMGNVK